MKSRITNLYGEEVLKLTKKLEKLRIIRRKLLCNLTFLCRCRDEKVIPKFAEVRYNIQNNRVKHILERASLSIIREKIKETRRRLSFTAQELLDIHLRLSGTMNKEDWNTIDQLTTLKEEWIHEKVKKNQVEKFKKLYTRKYGQSDRTKKKTTVINLTNKPIDPAITSLLEKGLNFAIAPTYLPIEKFITGIEAAIQHLQQETAEEIRNEVCHILKNVKKTKSNVKNKEMRALQQLRNKEDILVLPSDKGNNAVIIETEI
jgi:hypothetical protein